LSEIESEAAGTVSKTGMGIDQEGGTSETGSQAPKFGNHRHGIGGYKSSEIMLARPLDGFLLTLRRIDQVMDAADHTTTQGVFIALAENIVEQTGPGRTLTGAGPGSMYRCGDRHVEQAIAVCSLFSPGHRLSL